MTMEPPLPLLPGTPVSTVRVAKMMMDASGGPSWRWEAILTGSSNAEKCSISTNLLKLGASCKRNMGPGNGGLSLIT